MTVAPNATCPRCNGPATQAFSKVYCRADCGVKQLVVPGGTVPVPYPYYRITYDGTTLPTSSRRVARYYGGRNVPLPHEVPGHPTSRPYNLAPKFCQHPTVFRGNRTDKPNDRYYCWDCGAETADRP